MSGAMPAVSEAVLAELCQRYGYLFEAATIRDVCYRSVDDLTGSVATDEALPEMAIRLSLLRLDRLSQQQPPPERITPP